MHHAMLYGIASNDLSVVRHLIDAGADVNIKDQVPVTSAYVIVYKH